MYFAVHLFKVLDFVFADDLFGEAREGLLGPAHQGG